MHNADSHPVFQSTPCRLHTSYTESIATGFECLPQVNDRHPDPAILGAAHLSLLSQALTLKQSRFSSLLMNLPNGCSSPPCSCNIGLGRSASFNQTILLGLFIPRSLHLPVLLDPFLQGVYLFLLHSLVERDGKPAFPWRSLLLTSLDPLDVYDFLTIQLTQLFLFLPQLLVLLPFRLCTCCCHLSSDLSVSKAPSPRLR